MALLDILKQRKQNFGAPVTTSAEDVAQQQQQLATGKAGRSSAGPAMSNVGSQIQAQAGQAQRGTLAIQGLIQQQALSGQQAAQEQQFQTAQQGIQQRNQLAQADMLAQENMQEQERASREQMAIKELQSREQLSGKQLSNTFANALSDMASQRGIAEQEIFMEAQRARDEMDLEKYRAFLDQTAHVAAMSDQKYVDEIQRIGKKRNLQDDIAFKREAMDIAFGNDFQILQQSMNMQELINADRRESQDLLSRMDIDMALQMAENAYKEAAYKNIIQGAVNVGVGVASMSTSSGSTLKDNTGQGPTIASTGPTIENVPNTTIQPATSEYLSSNGYYDYSTGQWVGQ